LYVLVPEYPNLILNILCASKVLAGTPATMTMIQGLGRKEVEGWKASQWVCLYLKIYSPPIKFASIDKEDGEMEIGEDFGLFTQIQSHLFCWLMVA
jgi:hypothetical protein